MRSAEFRQWLGQRLHQGVPLTPNGIGNRVSKMPRVERALGALGFEERDVDGLHANGRWPELMSKLRVIATDWRTNEIAARLMAPQAADPNRQLGNLLNAARQYGHFADGKDPNYDAEADVSKGEEIDESALEQLKARFLAKFSDFESSGGFAGHGSFHGDRETYKRAAIAAASSLLRKAGEANDAVLGGGMLDLLVSEAGRGLAFPELSRKVVTIRRRDPGQLESASGALVKSDGDVVEEADRFLAVAWNLIVKDTEDNRPFRESRTLPTLLQALARPGQAIAVSDYWSYSNLGHGLLGRGLFANDRMKPNEYSQMLSLAADLFDFMEDWGWQPRDLWDVHGFIAETCGEKLNVDQEKAADRVREHALNTYILPARQRGDREVIIRSGDVHSDLGMTNAHANVCQALRGRKFQKMAGVDVPIFTGPDNSSTTTFTYRIVEGSASPKVVDTLGSAPTNLILYGPPGTGKTWATAEEAVKLCDGAIPASRDALMARYRELVEARRIDFVTFHQSYSYEDFVEGLRPVTDTAPDGQEGLGGTGFRLEPQRGIFREICTMAENARKNAGRSGGFDLSGRKLFKMSLGRAGLEDHIFDAAIDGNYVVLGWGGEVDWSEPRYEEWSAILERWKEDHPEAKGYDPNVVQMWPFRAAMKADDLVIVSAGNSHFRAIGEVTGPYRFDPTETRDYNHRRKVRWLLVPDEPLPAEMIYGKRFMMQSCYQLKDALVNKDALSALLPGGEVGNDSRADQFVLIIDEINRANISKVFGELITLIEPDKRKGAENALTVRLPYSHEPFSVPANLHLVGTMNTADRSIALLDTALRRRFRFRELSPDTTIEAFQEAVRDTGLPLDRVLDTINDRIEYLIDREHRIGHAFFIGCRSQADVDAVMCDKVIPLLQEYFFEDWSRVAAVLGERPGRGGAFLDCRKLKDPTGQGGEERESWSVRSAIAPDAYERLIRKVATASLDLTPDEPPTEDTE